MVPYLILASNSPRRRQLLGLTGWQFSVRPVEIDESPLPAEPPDAYVLRLAGTKAREAGRHIHPGEIILAADTTVADGDRILGKPLDAADAFAMLRDLRSRDHRVYTAIGITAAPNVAGGDHTPLVDLCETRVWMRSYSDKEIDAYIASGDPFDKAGAYAIQNASFHPVERIEGCYACVMGLPVCHVVRAMARFGLTPRADIADACQGYLETDEPCPAVEAILRQQPGGGQP